MAWKKKRVPPGINPLSISFFVFSLRSTGFVSLVAIRYIAENLIELSDARYCCSMVLQAHNLTLKYPGKILCRGLSLNIDAGQCWAVLGQNGCGKSTLLHALGGLHNVSGTESPVTVAGKAQHAWSRRELSRNLGILLQEEPGEFWGSVRDYVLLGRYPHVRSMLGWQAVDHDIATQAIERMELTGLTHRPLSTLSGGERQRARIALLLAQSPFCYLLDEPLQHLDLRHQFAVMMLFSELARQGKAVVMVLHDIAWASRYCSHVLMLFDNDGAIAGPTAQVLNQVNLEALYQCDMNEIRVNGERHFVPAHAMPSV
ncbi:ABC transporter ATP-binding protein [Nitrosovibrio tenuis]|uniref:Iron complex transport system ATP-binding protein n=1 Tax=Nitrosovibrio tenuis TaxID=1233 RepID=A0A1H7KAF8_9PROT|nr:ABC transporter ATP-binding protein [Nitrosovibrio tenuis]SEK83881.1 iron complex transport system ATP-binding protein [Nitrosovibrio tenuis]